MTPELASTLQRVYPDGTTSSLNADALKDERRDESIRLILESVSLQCGLRWGFELFDKPAYKIHMTQVDHPAFDEWIWKMSNAAKIKWIQQHGEPYPVLWLKISRVANFYYLHYNHWVSRGDTGHLDADFRRAPNEKWKKSQEILEASLMDRGFLHFSQEMAVERTPLVKEQDFDSIPDDDPRWENDDFEPPYVDATLHECLFSE